MLAEIQPDIAADPAPPKAPDATSTLDVDDDDVVSEESVEWNGPVATTVVPTSMPEGDEPLDLTATRARPMDPKTSADQDDTATRLVQYLHSEGIEVRREREIRRIIDARPKVTFRPADPQPPITESSAAAPTDDQPSSTSLAADAHPSTPDPELVAAARPADDGLAEVSPRPEPPTIAAAPVGRAEGRPTEAVAAPADLEVEPTRSTTPKANVASSDAPRAPEPETKPAEAKTSANGAKPIDTIAPADVTEAPRDVVTRTERPSVAPNHAAPERIDPVVAPSAPVSRHDSIEPPAKPSIAHPIETRTVETPATAVQTAVSDRPTRAAPAIPVVEGEPRPATSAAGDARAEAPVASVRPVEPPASKTTTASEVARGTPRGSAARTVVAAADVDAPTSGTAPRTQAVEARIERAPAQPVETHGASERVAPRSAAPEPPRAPSGPDSATPRRDASVAAPSREVTRAAPAIETHAITTPERALRPEPPDLETHATETPRFEAPRLVTHDAPAPRSDTSRVATARPDTLAPQVATHARPAPTHEAPRVVTRATDARAPEAPSVATHTTNAVAFATPRIVTHATPSTPAEAAHITTHPSSAPQPITAPRAARHEPTPVARASSEPNAEAVDAPAETVAPREVDAPEDAEKIESSREASDAERTEAVSPTTSDARSSSDAPPHGGREGRTGHFVLDPLADPTKPHEVSDQPPAFVVESADPQLRSDPARPSEQVARAHRLFDEANEIARRQAQSPYRRFTIDLPVDRGAPIRLTITPDQRGQHHVALVAATHAARQELERHRHELEEIVDSFPLDVVGLTIDARPSARQDRRAFDERISNHASQRPQRR